MRQLTRISKRSKKIRTEYQEARKIVYGDVNGDGTKDAVVQYTLEGAGGGNSWGQSLAVFLSKKGEYRLAGDETVGGKFFPQFHIAKSRRQKNYRNERNLPDG